MQGGQRMDEWVGTQQKVNLMLWPLLVIGNCKLEIGNWKITLLISPGFSAEAIESRRAGG